MGKSGSDYRVVPAGLRHIADLKADGFRQEDIDEWVIGTAKPIEQAVWESVVGVGISRAFLYGDQALAVWGASWGPRQRPGLRCVWFAASMEAPKHAIAIHRCFKEEIVVLQPPGFTLMACTYWRNTTHHRWLEAHGFVNRGCYSSILNVPYFRYMREPPP